MHFIYYTDALMLQQVKVELAFELLIIFCVIRESASKM